jgi:hypothetical protein
MPIIINEMDMGFPDEPPTEGSLASRVAELEQHVESLEMTVRNLARYCEALEATCRTAFADLPGQAPFPIVPRP